LAKQLNVVLPISYFEVKNNAYYNAIAIIDADGKILGNYRKSHIPDGPGYLEKYYFNPGDTGFKVWNTKFGKIGVGICWDQWFPEAARIMALKGAEILLYPTAIGDEPKSKYDSSGAWQRVMQGHAAANIIPVVASNRIGTETMKEQSNGFYGSSFICDRTGLMLAEASRNKEEVITAEIDLEDNHLFRRNWGIFRDRRVDLYNELLTLDGNIKD
jgi:N-carbamoylputrescine amidase